MDYDDYVNRAHQAAQAVEDGECEQALSIFQALPASDISDVDKAMMCNNAKTGHNNSFNRTRDGRASYLRP